ncbi:50S ribosomal protein L24 [Candidatus Saccharibacteria bacterium]|nr:50S ribosomal protein L24 [Candidatus Saccharibacteria bacterium]MCA9328243.1 50S ribosomal protein L24 [Candidatus Saccharibacteria bacterium]
MRLKKGDTVVVLAGKYKGQTGKITATHPTMNMVTVENINVVKRAVKPTQLNPQGGIVEKTKPVPVSNVAIVEPTSKKPSKIGYKFDKEGNKVRIYKRTGKEIK